MLTTSMLILIFILAIVFTWTNGFQHASAVAANAIGSHAIGRNHVSVLIFVFELLGTLFGGSAVAGAVQSISSWPETPDLLPILASSLIAAITWNFLARKTKMPASSTHSLLGGLIGALIAGDKGFQFVRLGKFSLIHPTGVIGAVCSLFISPMLGFIAGYLAFTFILFGLLRASNRANKILKKCEWFGTAALAFGDGQNDTQKTMGLLMLALHAAGHLGGQSDIPIWMRLLIGVTMGAGAFSISQGLIKKLAFGVYDIKPIHACSAQGAAASVLIANSLIGGPVSASQVIAAGLMGSGSAERYRGINWLAVKDIALSWLITIPAAAVLAGLIDLVLFQWCARSL